ncbi:HlyD family type I secretion periplasmic adaptor subunit [Burkholderiaceae bacterium DAT-1]|nr:HlyD family type I secretion periplasmic adaptor subunit [Burkholderiaceae bacterium DAT-1]
MRRLSAEEQALIGIKMSGGIPVDHAKVEAEHGVKLRVGWWVAIVGFGGFLTWAVSVPLDGGISLGGVVSFTNSHSLVQHQNGGTVREIFVREGALVRKGDSLIQLDMVDARAQLATIEGQYISLHALQSRLKSERDRLDHVAFDPDLLDIFADDPRLQDAMRIQEQLFASRRATRDSERSIFREQIAGLHAQLDGYKALRNSRMAQSESLHEELRGVSEMAKDGYVPRNRLLQMERSAADIDAALGEVLANSTRTLKAIEEVQLRAIAREQEFEKEVQGQLVDVERESNASAERLTSALHALLATNIKAPIDGEVMSLAVNHPGAVIQPGMHILEIVPQHDAMLVEVQLAPESVQKAVAGTKVNVSFPTLSHEGEKVLKGTISYVSADRTVDQRTGRVFYSMKVTIPQQEMKRLGRYQLKPGMNAMVVIKTGEHTLYNYLVKPLKDRIGTAFSEE